jgi:hypothetical protein
MSSTDFRVRALLIGLIVGGLFLLPIAPSMAGECQNWQTLHPEWIFCDDFEDGTAIVRSGRYFDYDNNGGDFVVVHEVGHGGSKGMRARWQQGEVDAGYLQLSFGRNPGAGMSNGIRPTEDFREIYYRMYIRLQSGWSGYPAKLSRATVIAGSDWRQAMIAHLWTNDAAPVAIDPASCVSGATVQCTGYNDFAHLRWLGAANGITPIFDGQALHNDRWYCVEAHVKLNESGQQNGVQEYWIDESLEARKAGLNFVGTYSVYGINAIFFENYWNSGSLKLHERYFDNIVVSTQPIGCMPLPPTNLRIVP